MKIVFPLVCGQGPAALARRLRAGVSAGVLATTLTLLGYSHESAAAIVPPEIQPVAAANGALTDANLFGNDKNRRLQICSGVREGTPIRYICGQPWPRPCCSPPPQPHPYPHPPRLGASAIDTMQLAAALPAQTPRPPLPNPGRLPPPNRPKAPHIPGPPPPKK